MRFTENLSKKLKKRNMAQFRVLKFLVKFNIFAIPLYIALIFNIQFYSLQVITAQLTESFLLGVGIAAARDGILISIPIAGGYWAAQIVWDCIGWKSILAFLALVFATDFPRRKKIMALVFVPVISFVNLFRIWFMFWFVYTFDLAYYQIVHTVIWTWGLLITVLVLWLVWMKKFSN